jgi:hypothetical protein
MTGKLPGIGHIAGKRAIFSGEICIKKTFPPVMIKSMECPAGEGIEMNGGLTFHPIS